VLPPTIYNHFIVRINEENHVSRQVEETWRIFDCLKGEGSKAIVAETWINEPKYK
jgi:hypothetical protein